MDVREKLVELLGEVQETGVNEIPAGFGCTRQYITNEIVAAHLISHGVTVQEWISVDDRLPDKPMRCLVYTKRGGYCGYDITYYNQGFYSEYSKVTHWMPMPEPPKGE